MPHEEHWNSVVLRLRSVIQSKMTATRHRRKKVFLGVTIDGCQHVQSKHLLKSHVLFTRVSKQYNVRRRFRNLCFCMPPKLVYYRMPADD